jgi:activator of HSP90 ATPase
VNLEIRRGKKIVQTWRASDWPADHYSTVTFVLKPVKGGTRLTFTQTGVPDNQYAGIKQGWIEYYWKPMKALWSGRRTK